MSGMNDYPPISAKAKDQVELEESRRLVKDAIRFLKGGMWTCVRDNRFGQRERVTFCMPDIADVDNFLSRAQALDDVLSGNLPEGTDSPASIGATWRQVTTFPDTVTDQPLPVASSRIGS